MDIQYGDWKILRKIGSGSFGTVYEIERESFGFRQKAALKVISIPQSQSDVDSIRNTGMDEASIGDYYRDLASEIVKELQTMEQLKGHTNIVSYEDHEIRPREVGIGWEIFIRMELLTPLQKYLNEHQMSCDEVVRLGIDLCRALERCESLNIIHRDIKPDNIFLSAQGDFELGDFGIARTVERTMSGMSKKGTYSYMAPEVYMGQPYGRTVDIYSLGLVLYRLLNYNRGPFLPAYPNPIKFQDQEQSIVRRIKGERLPPPALADQKLTEIVLKACSFEPAQRYSFATQMRQALQSLRVEAPLIETVPLSIEDRDCADRQNDDVLAGEATFCGADSEQFQREKTGQSVQKVEAAQDANRLSSSQQDNRLFDGSTASGHQPQSNVSEYAPAEQVLNEGTISGFHGVKAEEPVTGFKDCESDPVRGQLMHDGTVSVFSQQAADSANGSEFFDDGTVSVFGHLKKKDDRQPEASRQEIDSAREKIQREQLMREKEQREEQERLRRTEEENKKRKRKRLILIIVAVLISIIGGCLHPALFMIAVVLVPVVIFATKPIKPKLIQKNTHSDSTSSIVQQQYSKQNRVDNRSGSNQGVSDWGGTPQPAGKADMRADRYTPPPLTTVLRAQTASSQNQSVVVRMKTGERFPVATAYFRIGRDYDAELCVADNSAVGRKHAVIVSHDGAYFLIDNHSTNHSYINQMQLTPDVEHRLYPGTEFVLGNEAFRFEG